MYCKDKKGKQLLKRMGKYQNMETQVRLVITIVPVVLLLIVIFFMLISNAIIRLSEDRLALESKNGAQDIAAWAQQTISELDIYKTIIEQLSDLGDDEVLAFMETSADTHPAYPYGLYLGDDNGVYLDASGWVPGEDFVVTERNWYIEGLKHEEFTFGEPYIDAMTGDVCVSVTAKLDYAPSERVLAADVYMDYASKLVNEVVAGNIEEAFFSTKESRIIVVDSNADMVGCCLKDENGPEIYRDINQILDEGNLGQSVVEVKNEIYYINVNEIENTDWYFVTCISEKEMLKNFRKLELIMLLVALIAALILVVAISRIVREISEIRSRAETDFLTKLLNRNGFKKTVLHAVQERPNQGVLLMLDMDNFKLINDNLGHPAGDIVLRQFAVLLEEYYNRNKDIVARIGGDEFAVFVGRAITEEEVRKMLEKFILLVHENFDKDYSKYELSVSIGASFVEENAYEALYQRADEALYKAKGQGKNSYYIWKNVESGNG